MESSQRFIYLELNGLLNALCSTKASLVSRSDSRRCQNPKSSHAEVHTESEGRVASNRSDDECPGDEASGLFFYNNRARRSVCGVCTVHHIGTMKTMWGH